MRLWIFWIDSLMLSKNILFRGGVCWLGPWPFTWIVLKHPGGTNINEHEELHSLDFNSWIVIFMKCLFKRSMRRRRGYLSQRIHVSYIHLHLADFYATVNVDKYTIQESYGLCSLCRNSRKTSAFYPLLVRTPVPTQSHSPTILGHSGSHRWFSNSKFIDDEISETRTWPLT